MGALPDNGILENTLRLSSASLVYRAARLTLLTHSIAWTGVFWKLDPVFFWMSTKCHHTHTHLLPPHLFFSPSHACCGGGRGPCGFPSSFCLPPFLTAQHYMAPPLASLRVWGVKCTINAIFMAQLCLFFCVFLLIFLLNKYCTVCIFFFSFSVYIFFSPPLH